MSQNLVECFKQSGVVPIKVKWKKSKSCDYKSQTSALADSEGASNSSDRVTRFGSKGGIGRAGALGQVDDTKEDRHIRIITSGVTLGLRFLLPVETVSERLAGSKHKKKQQWLGVASRQRVSSAEQKRLLKSLFKQITAINRSLGQKRKSASCHCVEYEFIIKMARSVWSNDPRLMSPVL